MSALSFMRGHTIVWSKERQAWLYVDTKKIADDSRACIKCNQLPTKEGHDACLGYVEGIISACCGHGVEQSYMRKE